MPIKVLSPQVANQIAAGEVVERPASVVRELVDNAIDAGASDVAISLREGGRILIRVVDNGVGMSREDATLAFERHATSKLTELSDLDQIHTLGFRGEALPAISSVSRVRLQTRREADQVATEISIGAGKPPEIRSVPGATGTTVEVMQLFSNTPARQKFLKTTRSEELRVKQWLLQYSLSRPRVAFRLESDGKELFHESMRSSLVDRARVLIGAGVVECEMEVNGIRVEGALAHPSHARAEARGLTLIVNDRVVSDRMLLRAVKDGFGGALKDREFPAGVISISVAGTEVDVNVHPQKSEVRFRNSSAVYVAVLRAVQSTVAEFRAPMPGITTRASGSTGTESIMSGGASWSGGAMSEGSRMPHSQAGFRFSRSGVGSEVGRGENAAYSPYVSDDQRRVPSLHTLSNDRSDDMTPGLTGRHAGEDKTFSFRDLSFRGQIFECYLLCEHHGSFYVVDMHAAHERYQYNRIRASLRARDKTTQRLLLPLTITLSELEYENLRARQVVLEDLGFGIRWDVPAASLDADRHSAGRSISIEEIPAILVNRAVEQTVREIAALNMEEGSGIAPLEYLLDQIAARVACHASIRSGKRMTTPEVEALFALLDSSACSAACPHGRPVVVSFREADVERWFGRDR